MSAEDPTADYRKYPKGPNFLLIVILSGIAILAVLAVALFLVHGREKDQTRHTPDPTPNSLVQPLRAADPLPPMLS